MLLFAYVRDDGGVLILCGIFSSLTRPPDAKRLFTKFGKSWDFGNYTRTDFQLTSTGRKLLEDFPYNAKAVPLCNTMASERIYEPTMGDTTQSPVVLGRVGKGYLAYVGDVNGERSPRGPHLRYASGWPYPSCLVCGPVRQREVFVWV